jgi:hypothetical protein
MDRTLIEEHLAPAKRHVTQGQECIVRERELIQRLERDGRDTSEACRLLDRFEELQALFSADRERIRKELETSTAGQGSTYRTH